MIVYTNSQSNEWSDTKVEKKPTLCVVLLRIKRMSTEDQNQSEHEHDGHTNRMSKSEWKKKTANNMHIATATEQQGEHFQSEGLLLLVSWFSF